VGTGLLVDHYGWNGALWLYSGSAVIGCALLAVTWSKAAVH
jgi:sugar phosphate permease